MAGQPPMNLQEAVAALKAEQQAAVPEAPRSEEERKRLNYSRKCSDQIMDRAAEKIRKEAAWEAAVKEVGKNSAKIDLQVSRGAGDWLVSMMKTGTIGRTKSTTRSLWRRWRSAPDRSGPKMSL